MFGDTNIVIINELSNTLAFFILSIFHLRNLSTYYLEPDSEDNFNAALDAYYKAGDYYSNTSVSGFQTNIDRTKHLDYLLK